MGLKIGSLFSGSTGNCTYVCGGKTNILIDAGVSHTKIEKALASLQVDASALSVFVTHRHSDHIAGLSGLIAAYPQISVYAHERTVYGVQAAGVPFENIYAFGEGDFYVGDLTVTPVPLRHDVPCVGFTVCCGGKKLAYLTDTGELPASAESAAADADIVVLECNHEPELVLANPHYPPMLKKRILGASGHLSNQACAAAAVRLCKKGVKRFILAHLSKENNYPELAYAVVQGALSEAGLSAEIAVAPADHAGELFEI